MSKLFMILLMVILFVAFWIWGSVRRLQQRYEWSKNVKPVEGQQWLDCGELITILEVGDGVLFQNDNDIQPVYESMELWDLNHRRNSRYLIQSEPT